MNALPGVEELMRAIRLGEKQCPVDIDDAAADMIMLRAALAAPIEVERRGDTAERRRGGVDDLNTPASEVA